MRIEALMAAALLGAGCGEGVIDEFDATPFDEDIHAEPQFLGDPANGAVFAVDVSFWEGPLSQYETDCFFASGVRHLVAGTQLRETTVQQLSMAVARGMTVDAYVYLYFDRDVVAQVDNAFEMVRGFPVGRMWLDVEQNPEALSASALAARIQAAVDACRARATAECGIYTGPGFWKSYLANTTRFADLPLWYALYNRRTSLSDWNVERFGGWTSPEGKQWAEEVLCAVGVDKDTMRATTRPSVIVDRTLPPATARPPDPPAGLYPVDGSAVGLEYAKLMVSTVPRATAYQFQMESWDGVVFRAYATWTTIKPFKKVWPVWPDRIYRFRARAQNAYGWSAWSAWSAFDFGRYTGPRPGTEPPPVAPPPPPPGTSVPVGLQPDGVTMTTASVTMSCSPVAGASRYEFSIEYGGGTLWTTYTSYLTTLPTKTFWPQVHGRSYRWRVRATVNGVAGTWSAWATFQYP